MEMRFSDYSVHYSNEFPKEICNACLRKLEEISLFIEILKYSDTGLENPKPNRKIECADTFESVVMTPKSSIEKSENWISFQKSNYCEVCLCLNSPTTCEKNRHLIQLLFSLTGGDRTEDSSRNGVWLCSFCIDKLKDISSFIKLSLSSDEVFKKIIDINGVIKLESCSNGNGTEHLKLELAFDGGNEKDTVYHLDKSRYEVLDVRGEILDRGVAFQTPRTDENVLNHTLEKRFEYVCCERTFFKLPDIMIHLRNHNREMRFKCNYCDKGLTTSEEPHRSNFHNSQNTSLQQHSLTHNEQMSHKCKCCDKSFTDKLNLELHLLTYAGEEPLDQSNKEYSQQKVLIHAGEEKIRYESCKKQIFNSSNSITHLQSYNRGNSFICEYCGRKCTRPSLLKKHLRTHTGEKPYKCDYCEKRFRCKASVQVHRLIHTQNHKCDCCEKTFKGPSSLEKHLLTHTQRPLECNFCNRTFNFHVQLRLHLRIHTGEKPYECKVCNRSFARSASLQRHLRTHTGEEPYKCDQCGKCFRWRTTLKSHMLIVHTGERPFKCDCCEKRYLHRWDLKNHMRTHTGENPFECNFCKRTFNHRPNLRHHLRIHTGEKPYKCKVCDRSFTLNANLQRHLRTHTGEKPYVCNFCEKSYTQRSSLQLHLRTHSGQDHDE